MNYLNIHFLGNFKIVPLGLKLLMVFENINELKQVRNDLKKAKLLFALFNKLFLNCEMLAIIK
jgi:hypothetical protein